MTCNAITQTAAHGVRSASRLHRAMNALRGLYAPAPIIDNGQRPDGWPDTMPDLTARAMRINNRSKEAAEAYLRMHRTLSKACSEGK